VPTSNQQQMLKELHISSGRHFTSLQKRSEKTQCSVSELYFCDVTVVHSSNFELPFFMIVVRT